VRGEGRTALLVGALLVLSVPWYFPAGDGSPFVFGFPLWALVSLGCYAAIAALVAWRLPRIWRAAPLDEEADG
jgi:hypothetical protein